MTSRSITIPGAPVPKGRPRVYRGHGITPQRTRDAEIRVRSAWMAKYPRDPPSTAPLRIRLRFWMPDRRTRDWDNLAKLATDALNSVAWKDDVQIVEARVSKILPDTTVRGRRGMRRRRPSDPLTFHGVPYEAHTEIVVDELDTPTAITGKEQP